MPDHGAASRDGSSARGSAFAILLEVSMPKGQRSSKEAKKPKKDATVAKPLQTGESARPTAPVMPELVKKKKPAP
jgi:hypothetical protein